MVDFNSSGMDNETEIWCNKLGPDYSITKYRVDKIQDEDHVKWNTNKNIQQINMI